jgi:phosphate transport system permease protein
MPPLLLFALVLALGLVGWAVGRARAAAFAGGASLAARPHSVKAYHGWYLGLWAAVPALLFLLAWQLVSPSLVADAVLHSPAAASLPAEGMDRAAVLEEARGLATGEVAGAFNPLSTTLAPAFRAAIGRYALLGTILTLLIAFAGGVFGFVRLRPSLRARTKVERLVMAILLLASLIAILTTIGIVASLLLEALRFFAQVSPFEFLFGLEWSPQTALRADQAGSSGAFGAVPLFWGTMFIGAIIAMIVAVPLGLMSAIYLTQYAHPTARK